MRDTHARRAASRTSRPAAWRPLRRSPVGETHDELTVTFDMKLATWYLACGLPGPAGQARLHLGEGVILAADRADSHRVLELSVELPDLDDPSGTPTAEGVGLVEALFGTEAAKLATTPAAHAAGGFWELPLDPESQCARHAACRLALLSEARDDVEGEASLWSAEAALLARLVAPTMEPVVRAEAATGAVALRGLSDTVCEQLPAAAREHLCPVAAVVRSVVGGDSLLDRFCDRSHQRDWARDDVDVDELARLARTIWRQRHTDAADHPMLMGAHLMAGETDERDSTETGRWIPLDPSAMSLPVELLDPRGMVAIWDPVTRSVELKAALLPDGSDDLTAGVWARAYQYRDGALLALQRARVVGGALVARLPVPPDVDVATVCVDLTTQPGLTPPSAELRHYQAAVRIGRMAADLDRLGHWADAAARWTECAQYWHSELGDSQRAAMAFACAARSHTLMARQLSTSQPKAAVVSRRAARLATQQAKELATSWAAAFVDDPGDLPAPFLAEIVQPLLGLVHHGGQRHLRP